MSTLYPELMEKVATNFEKKALIFNRLYGARRYREAEKARLRSMSSGQLRKERSKIKARLKRASGLLSRLEKASLRSRLALINEALGGKV